jgi:hypothetical protein
VPTTKISPAAHLACCNACNGYVTVRKRSLFLFSVWGGAVPQTRQAGVHLPRDYNRSAPGVVIVVNTVFEVQSQTFLRNEISPVDTYTPAHREGRGRVKP